MIRDGLSKTALIVETALGDEWAFSLDEQVCMDSRASARSDAQSHYRRFHQ